MTLVTHHLVFALVLTNIRNQALVHIAHLLVGEVAAIIPPIAQQISMNAGSIFAAEVVGAIASPSVSTQTARLVGSIAAVRFSIAR